MLESSAGQSISVTNIVDIMNMIGKCVVAGNVRRTAEIAFGSPFSGTIHIILIIGMVPCT